MNFRPLFKIIVLFMLIFCPALKSAVVPWQDGRSKAEDLQIKLVTFGPGDDIPSYWGHTALIVEDTLYRVSRIYNFGLFSFNDGMLFKFAMGRLIFSGGHNSVPGYLAWYKRLNRDIRIATLKIPLKKRLILAKELAWNVLPENKDYLYDHYRDNCSTRLRDFIDDAVDGQLAEATKTAAPMNLREHTRRYVGRSISLEFLLMFLMNSSIDQPILKWDEMFLPDELERYVSGLEYTDSLGAKHKLVSDRLVFYEDNRAGVPDRPFNHEWPLLLFGTLCALVSLLFVFLLANKKSSWNRVFYGAYNFLVGVFLGLPGFALALMAAFTDHTVTFYNINLLLLNPLTLLLIPAGVAYSLEKPWGRTGLFVIWNLHGLGCVLLFVLKLFNVFEQDNNLVLCLLVPLILGGVLASWLDRKKL